MKLQLKNIKIVNKPKKRFYKIGNQYFFNVLRCLSMLESTTLNAFSEIEITQSPYSNSVYINLFDFSNNRHFKIRVSDHCNGFVDHHINSENGEFWLNKIDIYYLYKNII